MVTETRPAWEMLASVFVLETETWELSDALISPAPVELSKPTLFSRSPIWASAEIPSLLAPPRTSLASGNSILHPERDILSKAAKISLFIELMLILVFKAHYSFGHSESLVGTELFILYALTGAFPTTSSLT